MKRKIVVKKVYTKTGMGAKGEWQKTDIVDEEDRKYSTFERVNIVEGGEYEIEHSDSMSDYGRYEIASIKPLSVSGNELKASNRQDAIIRQHSQEMALRCLIGQGNTFEINDIFNLADKFDDDVKSKEVPF